jgi:hypothetical protein
MDASAATKVSIILKSRDDWRAWYDNIQSLAKARDVWEYINPDTKKEELPQLPKEPEIPDIEELPESQWKIHMQLWTARTNKYEKIKRGLAVVNEAIRGSISTLLIHHIYGKESVYDILKALKTQFAPTKHQQSRMILAKYEKARKTSIKDSNLEIWLATFEAAYLECLAADRPEVKDQHAVRHFLEAVSRHSPSWAERRFDDLQRDEEIELPEILAQFRGYTADIAVVRRSRSDAAFATLKGQSDEASEPVPSPMPRPKCLCGAIHRFLDCPYVMTLKQPSNWVPKPEIEARFTKLLKGPRTGAQFALKKGHGKEFQDVKPG